MKGDGYDSHMTGHGARDRFKDKLSGDYLEYVRNHSVGIGMNMPFGKRFCESCQSAKPRGKRKAVKGWRCDDCLTAKRGES